MQTGDSVIVYHSGAERAAVGIARVYRPAYPDPTDDTGQWECVDLVFEQRLARPIRLEQIKATPALRTMQLLKQSRLSVMPLSLQEYQTLLQLAQA